MSQLSGSSVDRSVDDVSHVSCESGESEINFEVCKIIKIVCFQGNRAGKRQRTETRTSNVSASTSRSRRKTKFNYGFQL